MSTGGSQIKTKRDKDRKWMWWLLGIIAALQVYFVQELLAAFALFAMAFLAIAGATVSVYMLHRGWAVTVDRVADSLASGRAGPQAWYLERRRHGPPSVPASWFGAARELRNGVLSLSQSTRRTGTLASFRSDLSFCSQGNKKGQPFGKRLAFSLWKALANG